jgi:1-deoxy-D-xylulose-5-phosphate synthase
MKKLENYHFPEDLKTMNNHEMELLSAEIREFLIDHVSRTGGHLASNLGVVELTVALHRVFDSPKDKIIWDVGHQSYVHKILTGRADQFDHLRMTGGMSGFPKKCESVHDVYQTGHSSTSISAAAGMAAARDIRHEHYNVIAVIGDGSLTGGMVYEAMNNIGISKSKVIIIVNDNGMSISKNIGGMSEHLTKLRTSRKYLQTKSSVKKKVQSIPLVGQGIYEGMSAAKNWMKYALMSGGILFEELGFTYLGPVDGHDIPALRGALTRAKRVNGPVVLHVMTRKGKGYLNAEKDPGKFHGIGPFDPETGVVLKPSGCTWSKVFGKTMDELGKEDERIVAVTAAMGDATGLSEFAEHYPNRFFDVGIAEAHAVTFCAGLATNGLKPVAAIYSSFLQRAYDQIIEDVCIQNLPVVLAIDRAGIVGADGETHHGVFDLSFLSGIPNMHVFSPAEGSQLPALLRYALSLNTPAAVRYPRGGCSCDKEAAEYHGGNQRISEGTDVEIWAVGSMLSHAREAAEILEKQGCSVGIVSVLQVKPMDLSLLNPHVKLAVTLEDGIVLEGFGAMFQEKAPCGLHVLNLGWPDEFVSHGSPDDLYRMYGLDGEGIAESVRAALKKLQK